MKKVPYSPPKCTVCAALAIAFSANKEPRCTRHQRDPPQTRLCRCGSPMLIRENKTNHSHFWGCSNYPRCMETARI